MQLQVQNIKLDIISVGGLYTVVQLPSYKIAIDLGVCPRSSFNKGHIFFTHTHADHIAGASVTVQVDVYLDCLPPTYVIGQEDASNFKEFMSHAGKVVRSDMEYKVLEVSPGDRIPINQHTCV